MDKYVGFNGRDDVAVLFNVGTGPQYSYNDPNPFKVADDFPTEDEILFAYYVDENYSGDAFVLFEKNGKLFEVHGSHCSCYGLEDQWHPEETSWEALAIRPRTGYDSPTYCVIEQYSDTFWSLVDSHTHKENI